MADIRYLSLKKGIRATGYWDHTFINEMLENIGSSDRVVIVIPGAYQGDIIPEINKELAKYKKILVFVTSDEENKFDASKLEHRDMILYTQYGNGGYMFPLGYAPDTRETLKGIGLIEKDLKFFFAGQITHKRREKLKDTLDKIEGGETHYTDGFGKGLEKFSYLYKLASAKTAPCAAGAVSVDSFRIYEALEAGAIPITDDVSPLRSYRDFYWNKLFGDVPFPVFEHYKDLPGLIDKASRFKNYDNKIFAWWINKKYQIREQLKMDLEIEKDEVVAVVPVSPIPSHPDTVILEETIFSIRTHLDCPILLTFDGVRKEQESMRDAYQEFQRKMIWKCNFEYKNVLPIIFDKHSHQSGMMTVVLNQIDVPMILYVEQDTPLSSDMDIDWEKCKDYIRSGKAKVIRFHFEAKIPEPHKHLMIGKPEDGFQKTVQWSQRPHLASQDMYRIIIGLFSKDSNTFIEDYIHGVLQDLWTEQGEGGWDKWRVYIYHPEGNIKRSYHTDGREGNEKYDDRLIF